LWDKLEAMVSKIPELERLQADPAVTGNQRELQRVGRELAELRPISEAYARHRRVERELEGKRNVSRRRSGSS
jgi:peptide chain release factor 1